MLGLKLNHVSKRGQRRWMIQFCLTQKRRIYIYNKRHPILSNTCSIIVALLKTMSARIDALFFISPLPGQQFTTNPLPFLCVPPCLQQLGFQILRTVHLALVGCQIPGTIMDIGAAYERRHYIVTSSLSGWAHTQNDPWIYTGFCTMENAQGKCFYC